MNNKYITKRLEEFEKNVDLIEDLIKVVSDTDVLDTEDVENYYRDADRIINGSAIDNAWEALRLKGKLKELFADSIQQAVAEDREDTEQRVIEEIHKAFIENYRGAGEVWIPYVSDDECTEKEELEAVEAEWQGVLANITKK